MQSHEQEVRLEHREISENEKVDIDAIKQAGADFLKHIDICASHTADRSINRELAIAKTKVEEAVMWATKGITA